MITHLVIVDVLVDGGWNILVSSLIVGVPSPGFGWSGGVFLIKINLGIASVAIALEAAFVPFDIDVFVGLQSGNAIIDSDVPVVAISGIVRNLDVVIGFPVAFVGIALEIGVAVGEGVIRTVLLKGPFGDVGILDDAIAIHRRGFAG